MNRLLYLPVLAIFFLAPSSDGAETPVIEMGTRGVSNFIAKMEKDRTAHVAFLGGSITQKDTGHSKKVADWLKENWSDVDFIFTNAGLASTCSMSGAFRVDRDVLSQGEVDLLVLEFAVNDDQDAAHDRETAIRGLEGIVRQYFEANPKGDIISVQYVNPGILAKKQAGEEAVSVAAHKTVARHYDLPIVDVGQGLANEIAAGTMTWEADYGDTHPKDRGYVFSSGLITKVIDDTVSGETPQVVSIPEPLDPRSFDSIKIVDPQQLNWLGGWQWAPVSEALLTAGSIRADYKQYHALRSDEAGDYLYYTFSGDMLGAFVLAGPDAGMLEVSIDGGEWKAVDLYHERFSKGMNYPRSVILADGLSHAYHTAAIRVSEEKNELSRGHAATILHFAVNR
ncbi:MAG: SGNH/GDSL hydrolase family protein [Verrucomicrobiales bacterium]|nr:SGNH/GDSL hydrolase family protein [Verrucomicrobiales bacterium]